MSRFRHIMGHQRRPPCCDACINLRFAMMMILLIFLSLLLQFIPVCVFIEGRHRHRHHSTLPLVFFDERVSPKRVGARRRIVTI